VKKNILIVTAVVLLILILDQLLKIYIKTSFQPGETRPFIGDFLVLEYIENQGMAFGTRFGSSIWGKLSLSLFRIVAIGGIIYYWIRQARKGARLEFLIALGFVLAGAAGNLIDSMLYDYLFPVGEYLDCRLSYNQLEGSGNFMDCGFFGTVEVRHTGFLFGNVVDMFKFQAIWPDWVPYFGGSEVFPAIWNVADASITVGVFMILIRQKHYFSKKLTSSKAVSTDTPEVNENEA
jgi:signal peptidase II